MSSPRILAIEAIDRIKHDGAYANLLSNELLAKANFSPQDAAFFTDIVNGTVRYLRYLDHILSQCVTRKLDEIESNILIILESAAYLYLIRDKAQHAIVNEAVQNAREIVGERAVGFCNAVLRKLVSRTPAAWKETLTVIEDSDERFAIEYSIPDWIYAQYKMQMSNDRELRHLLNTLNTPPQVSLLKPPGNRSEVRDLSPGNWSPFSYRENRRGILGSTLLDSGFIVQDEGSQLVSLATVTAPIDGTDVRWLDMTAGPGGKATFLAAAANIRNAKLIANELHPHRARLVSSTMKRLDLSVEVTVGNALTQSWNEKFDRVLLDAPCTGLGAIRRRAESRWRKQESDLVNLVDLQKRLINKAISVTRVGGIVAYTTCSLHPRETTEVIDFACKASNVEVIDVTKLVPMIPVAKGPYLRLWPHIHDTDGMFMAVLKVG